MHPALNTLRGSPLPVHLPRLDRIMASCRGAALELALQAAVPATLQRDLVNYVSWTSFSILSIVCFILPALPLTALL